MMNVGIVNLNNPIFLQNITVFQGSFTSDGEGDYDKQYVASFMKACVQPNNAILEYKEDGNHTRADIVIYSIFPILLSDSCSYPSFLIEHKGFLYVVKKQEDWSDNGHYVTYASRKNQRKLAVQTIYETHDGFLYETNDGFLFQVVDGGELPPSLYARYGLPRASMVVKK